jgi:Uma2 family endonuclease
MAAVNYSDHSEYTLAEYVALERYSNVRHEFADGQVLAMAGGTPGHGRLAANVIALLVAALRARPCAVHTSDVRVRVRATGLVTYPDVSVVCGAVEPDDVDRDAVLNPVLLVEVTSPSTDRYDRGKKLDHYRQIESMRAVLFVAHEEPRLELVECGADGNWVTTAATAGGELRIGALECALRVDDVYRDPLRR